ncbi:AraC family transcriptional regulator [Shewanella livingstonensis]|uniref:AraC family transcriptional regulator n=1 Tax=Shewanella livingstonensis TaxID=150120 RepID=A0A3G8LSJ6_9GAMM|nr:GyrI-like domain-containing protein [Shewanella livingstonensis]AZG72753.1 AraC family transcriptional regulator [Shewanella livingstonensis]
MSHRLDKAFERALAYLDQHLHEPIDLNVLADVAQLPQSHFEALFYALYHMSIDVYVELLKSLEAAHLLGFGKQVSLATIAAKLAYRDQQHFIESFTHSIGQTPEAFQQSPDWGNFFAKQQPLKSFQPDTSQQTQQCHLVEIISLDEHALVVMQHYGDPALLPLTVERFIKWRQQHGLSALSSRTFNLLHSTPPFTPKTQYRIDIAVSLNIDIQARLNTVDLQHCDISLKSLPEGRYATLRCFDDGNGYDNCLAAAIDYLYRDWLNANDVVLRDFPLFIEQFGIRHSKSTDQDSIHPTLTQSESQQPDPQQDSMPIIIYLPIV